MAPQVGKRVKGVQVFRPFVYGTIARPFDPVKNPKPDSAPADHTHSWTVFVKGVDDTDITYWLRKVQFKLHESIPNPLRNVESPGQGQMFRVEETGWGEFEIQIKLHYVPESGEKPQTIYHHLRLHPYGTEEEKAKSKENKSEVQAWCYEEQLFNEPFEQFYDILTGSVPTTGKGKGSGGAGKVTKKEAEKRVATVPPRPTPGQPYSRETEVLEMRKLREAQAKVDEQVRQGIAELKAKEARLAELRNTEVGV